MIRPDDEDRLFVARWSSLVSALLIEPSVKLVAMQAAQYGIADGEDIYPGNERLARQTGLTEKTVREAWHFLRGTGMAIRDARSAWTGDRRTADLYELVIPEHWEGFALLGPHSRRFTCQHCRKLFNPPPCSVFATDKKGHPVVDRQTGNRQVRWRVSQGVFCPPPRKGPGCFADWQRGGGKWGDDAWAMFRKARSDEW